MNDKSKELEEHSAQIFELGCMERPVYLKEDVDVVIAELKQKLQDQCTSCPVKMQEDDVVAEFKQKLEDAKSTAYTESVDAGMENRRLKRALWLARAEHYKMREFIAREEANLSDQIAWSQFLRERTYNQWVGQLLRIANLANKLHNKCLAKAEEYYK